MITSDVDAHLSTLNRTQAVIFGIEVSYSAFIKSQMLFFLSFFHDDVLQNIRHTFVFSKHAWIFLKEVMMSMLL